MKATRNQGLRAALLGAAMFSAATAQATPYAVPPTMAAPYFTPQAPGTTRRISRTYALSKKDRQRRSARRRLQKASRR